MHDMKLPSCTKLTLKASVEGDKILFSNRIIIFKGIIISDVIKSSEMLLADILLLHNISSIPALTA